MKCECGKPSVVRDMCMRCYDARRRRKKGIPKRPKGTTMIVINCGWCGREFKKKKNLWKHNEKKGMRHFCTKSCASRHTNAQRKGMGNNRVMFQCAACGNVCEKPLRQWKSRAKEGKAHVMCCNLTCAAYYRHSKRYKGKRIEPRLIENMKL